MKTSPKQSRSDNPQSPRKRNNSGKARIVPVANGNRLSVRLGMSLYAVVVALLSGIVVAWFLVRLGAFFLLPPLSSQSQQTVNVSPWWILGVLIGVALLVIALLYACDRFLKIHTPLTWVAFSLIVAAVCFESFVQVVIPSTSLAAWVFFGNTQASSATYVRQVDATPYSIRYRGMHFNGEVTNARIANWQCDAEPITTRMRFTPAFARHPPCVTVHQGLLGWEWIENLRVCSKNDLVEAVRSSACRE